MLKHLLEELRCLVGVPVNLTDSDAGRALATRLGVGKQRHIQTRYLWLQEKIRGHALAVKRLPGERNVGDLGTKHLDAKRMQYLLGLMGLISVARRSGAAQVAVLASCVVTAGATRRDGEGSGRSETEAPSQQGPRLWLRLPRARASTVRNRLVSIARRRQLE